MLRKVDKWSGIHIRNPINAQFNHFYNHPLPMPTKFPHLRVRELSCAQTDGQSQTHRHTWVNTRRSGCAVQQNQLRRTKLPGLRADMLKIALPSKLKLAASTLDHFCSRLKTVLFIRSYYACMSAAVHNCVISPAWYINAVTLTLTIPAQLAGVQVMKCTQNLSLYSSYSPELCRCPTFNIQNCMPLTVILLLSSVKVLIGEIWRVASSDSLTPKQSKRCLRIIFLQLSYSEALDKSGLNRLDTRREEITKQIFRQIKSPTHPLHYLIPTPKFSVLRWY